MSHRFNTRGELRQRWPAPPPRGQEVRSIKAAFKVSPELYARIRACADRAQMPISSWVEQLIRRELERHVG